jgi:uncharacterized protein (DUF58 family)
MTFFKVFKKRFAQWLSRRHGVQTTTIELDRQRIYILPSGYGYAFCGVLLVMLLWAINYANSLAFVLTFLLGAVALNAMWRTHNNLLRLRITPGSAEPVFAGQQARFSYFLAHADGATRYGIGLQWGAAAPCYSDVPTGASATVVLPVPAPRRGRLQPGPVRVLTRFPLGLFQAWSWVRFDRSCLVYPAPHGELPLPQPAALSATPLGVAAVRTGSEDYAGLRAYAAGDSPRHIAWRASARADSLLVKRFSGQARAQLWLDWQQLAPHPIEERLSQLCRWVLTADAQGDDYGLRLTGLEIPPASGAEQRRRCLQALALFGDEQEN